MCSRIVVEAFVIFAFCRCGLPWRSEVAREAYVICRLWVFWNDSLFCVIPLLKSESAM